VAGSVYNPDKSSENLNGKVYLFTGTDGQGIFIPKNQSILEEDCIPYIKTVVEI